ncbi:MAG TPA: methyltransferase domain-containing protein [Phycisphaerae bacterium]|nr:methyltransferase domain-containing protein [Phycisphaerae bacterium]
MVGRYETQEYVIPVAGRTLRLLGPKRPHSLRNDPAVEQRFLDDGYMPYWATPWPGALMLAEYVIRNVEPTPEPVLEIGAGLGLVGLSLAMAGHRVIVTDYDQDALAFARANAALNGVDLDDVRLLDWREPPDERFARIVAGEVLYEKRDVGPIASLIASCLEPTGLALVSAQHRTAVEDFPGALADVGLSCEAIPVQCRAIPRPDAIDARILNGTVFRIGHRQR